MKSACTLAYSSHLISFISDGKWKHTHRAVVLTHAGAKFGEEKEELTELKTSHWPAGREVDVKLSGAAGLSVSE